MIEVRYKARLGNNLFQYCLGRILAEGLGLALQAEVIPGFPNTAQLVDGARCKRPKHIFTGQLIDLDGILADRSVRRLVLDGWFQRHEYYRPHRQKIREWLAFDPLIQVPDSRPDVVVHVRRRDFVQLGWALPYSYYAEALERVLPNGGDVWIVTDDRRDPFLKRFVRWRPQFYSGTALQQMLFMARAPRLVISQSTFSWWPTFLGNPQSVACPIPSFGAWSEQGEAKDATLIERDRFVCVECHEPYQAAGDEARYQERRIQWRRIVMALNRRLHLSLPEPTP